MNSVRRHLHWFHCVALSALLGLALVPTLSRALAAGDASGPWAEFCSVTGIQPLADSAPSDPDSDPARGAKHLDHCPLCGHHCNMLALPPAQVGSVPLLVAASDRPALFYLAPRPLFAWTSAQPRAPPVLS
ncbi:DUF2946 domain-containing protein [Methylibium sp.]|uniref:DUF2946 domain-containing protein n=1 Tax=Methylibium sp. TaxID=2067992 RepID=UPI003D0B8D34